MKINTTVEPHLVQAVPELDILLGCQIELSVRVIADEAIQARPISFEELLRHRLKKPDNIQPVTLEDIEQAIVAGASDASG